MLLLFYNLKDNTTVGWNRNKGDKDKRRRKISKGRKRKWDANPNKPSPRQDENFWDNLEEELTRHESSIQKLDKKGKKK